jgi:hypothetical protein
LGLALLGVDAARFEEEGDPPAPADKGDATPAAPGCATLAFFFFVFSKQPEC